MAGLQLDPAAPPFCEPLSLAVARNWLRVTASDDDNDITDLILAARESCEVETRRSFINKGYIQTLDSFPYFTDTVQSQQAMPPSYYSYPRYSTTLWNYSQMIKLYYSKLAAAPTITYIATDGTSKTLIGTTDPFNSTADFWADIISEPPRLFPRLGGSGGLGLWPAVLYHGNAIQIHFTAGYNDDSSIAAAVAAAQSPLPSPVWTAQEIATYEADLRRADVPAVARLAMKHLIKHWYDNRSAAMADQIKEVPLGVKNLLWKIKVMDVAPTRG